MGCFFSVPHSKQEDENDANIKYEARVHTIETIPEVKEGSSKGKKNKRIDVLKDLCNYIENTSVDSFDLNYAYAAAVRIKPVKVIPGHTITTGKPTANDVMDPLETQHTSVLPVVTKLSICSKMNVLLQQYTLAYKDDDATSEDNLWKCMSLIAYLGCKLQNDTQVLSQCRNLIKKRFYVLDPNVVPLMSSLDIHNSFSEKPHTQ